MGTALNVNGKFVTAVLPQTDAAPDEKEAFFARLTEILIRRYHLTTMQAEVVSRVFYGETLHEVATSRKVMTHSIRYLCSRGARRQPDKGTGLDLAFRTRTAVENLLPDFARERDALRAFLGMEKLPAVYKPGLYFSRLFNRTPLNP